MQDMSLNRDRYLTEVLGLLHHINSALISGKAL